MFSLPGWKTRAALAGCLLAMIASSGCGATSQAAPEGPAAVPGQPVAVDGGTYSEVTVPELREILETEDFPLINVHIPFAGDLPGTDLSIPFDEIGEHLDQLPSDRDALIVLYCRSGNMSAQAAEELVGLGYNRVVHLAGGFNAWEAAGLPVER